MKKGRGTQTDEDAVAKRQKTDTVAASLVAQPQRRVKIYSFLKPNHVLYEMADSSVQDMISGFWKRMVHRRRRRLPVGSANVDKVSFVDGSVVLPPVGTGAEDFDYFGKWQHFCSQILGSNGHWREREHFILLLYKPSLSRQQQDALRYHIFNLVMEKRSAYVPTVVERLKYKRVRYKGRWKRWDTAYDEWENDHYPTIHGKGKETLEAISKKDSFASMVYDAGHYFDSPSQKLKFSRNLYKHLNDHRVDHGASVLTPCQLGRLIEDMFPELPLLMFEFIFEMNMDLRFFII